MKFLRQLLRGKYDDASAPAVTGESSPEDRTIDRIAELSRAGKHAEAIALAEQVSAHGAPGDVAFARATVLLDWGRFREASDAYLDAEREGAPSATLLVEMGWAAFHCGQFDRALRWLQRSLAAEETARGHFAMGVVAQAKGDLEDAQRHLSRSLELDASSYDAHILIGGVCLDLKFPEDAERHFRGALALDDRRAAGWVNLGVALDRLDRNDEAEIAFRKAYALERASDDDVAAFVNLAVALRHKGDLEEGLSLGRHLVDSPKAAGHFVYGLTLATAGKLREAWPHHEFRWAHLPMVRLRAGFPKPAWSGQDLRGRTLLLRAEQGFGDTIQFVRYATWLKRLGARVVLRPQKGLERLARGFAGVDDVLTGDVPNPPFDWYLHPMSLPAVFGTDLTSIPSEGPYLRVDREAREKWQSRLPSNGKLRVGLVWAGSPEHQRDRYRSVKLSALDTLLATPGVAFYSLQKGTPSREIESVASPGRLIDLSADLLDFADTAAVLERLDLLICVDTAVAHVAGALGRPVWMLVSDPADWRWMLDRSDTPWYPSMRIFRQRVRGSWDATIDEIATSLASVVQGRDSLPAPWESATDAGAVPVPRPVPPIGDPPGPFAQVAECRYGIMVYFPDEPVVGPSLAWYGEYLQAQLILMMRYVPKGSVIVEAGAGVGAHALGLSLQLGPEGHLIAFESRSRHRQALMQNLGSNGAINVTLMRRSLEAGSPNERETIDDLALARLDWLKIAPDAEGRSIIAGASDTLWRCRPKLFVGVSSGSEVAAMAASVAEFGY